jgi:hypothetical protein
LIFFKKRFGLYVSNFFTDVFIILGYFIELSLRKT